MRKLATALLAVPVLAAVYLSTFVGRSIVARTGVALGVGALLAFGVIAAVHPAPATATPVGTDLPLTAAAFRTVVATDRDLDEPVTIDFSVPMDHRSVAAALTVTPNVAVRLSWDDAGQVLTVTPQHGWVAGHLSHDHRRRRRARRVGRAHGQPGTSRLPDPRERWRPPRRDRPAGHARRGDDGHPDLVRPARRCRLAGEGGPPDARA